LTFSLKLQTGIVHLPLSARVEEITMLCLYALGRSSAYPQLK